MAISYDVKVWKTFTYTGKRKKTHHVRWRVARNSFKRVLDNAALADSFHSQLVTASRGGEAFEVASGLPVSLLSKQNQISWFDFAMSYVKMKWPDCAPGSRRSLMDGVVPVAIAMTRPNPDMPEKREISRALRKAFNPSRKADVEQSEDVATRWVRRNSRMVDEISDPDVLRGVLTALETNLNGKRAAVDTARLRRFALSNSLDYAAEQEFLSENPLTEVKVKKTKYTLKEVDRRSVVNPTQARKLLNEVRRLSATGERLTAFFGLIYYAALRPEEAAGLTKGNLSIPEHGWGELHLERAVPEVSGAWTDSGAANEGGSLKHRADGEGRTVPCCPELTELLHDHLSQFGTASDGRLFRGVRSGGRIGSTTYGHIWAQARGAAFTKEVASGPLAKRPYDLRHAAVSTWLNAGVEATRVAKWAGHSLAVLLRVYAKCLDGGEQAARDRISEALGQETR
jgi:integrase